VGAVVTARPGVGIDPTTWWDTHDQGTNGRPRPGTRVLLRDGRRGTVTGYEGCWNAITFPALIDGTGQTLMFAARDVTVLTSVTDNGGQVAGEFRRGIGAQRLPTAGQSAW
jgi:hypothetical protein